MPKKYCTICDKQLAEANEEDICFCHQEGMVIKERTPVTGCTSYNTGSGDQPGAPDMYLKPGDAGYNEQAFAESILGAIDENGEVYEIDLGEAETQIATGVYNHPDQIISEETLIMQTKENKKFNK